jgi:PIN domain nuclease of toxin-antitoxin system
MAAKVLDSWALIAFFEDEPAAESVEKLLQQAADDKQKLLMSVVNWGEVYYSTMRAVSQEAAEQQAQEIAALPIEIIGVADDLALAKQAAIFKAMHKMALAKQKHAQLVTGDPEFKALENEIQIDWLK